MLALLLIGEVVREVLFHEGGAFHGLPPNEGFQLVYNAAFVAWPLVLGAAVRSLHRRERELAAQAVELEHERERSRSATTAATGRSRPRTVSAVTG